MTPEQALDDRAGPSVADDARWEPGMPVLDRQRSPAASPPVSARRAAPRSVPEQRPTPLQRHYVNLSVVVLLSGGVAISALELGASLASPLVKLCVVIGAPLLTVTTLDAAVRIWRSAWAWMPVDRGRGLFRLAWLVAAGIGLAAFLAGGALVLLS